VFLRTIDEKLFLLKNEDLVLQHSIDFEYTFRCLCYLLYRSLVIVMEVLNLNSMVNHSLRKTIPSDGVSSSISIMILKKKQITILQINNTVS